MHTQLLPTRKWNKDKNNGLQMPHDISTYWIFHSRFVSSSFTPSQCNQHPSPCTSSFVLSPSLTLKLLLSPSPPTPAQLFATQPQWVVSPRRPRWISPQGPTVQGPPVPLLVPVSEHASPIGVWGPESESGRSTGASESAEMTARKV